MALAGDEGFQHPRQVGQHEMDEDAAADAGHVGHHVEHEDAAQHGEVRLQRRDAEDAADLNPARRLVALEPGQQVVHVVDEESQVVG